MVFQVYLGQEYFSIFIIYTTGGYLSAHAAERAFTVGAGQTQNLAASVYKNIDTSTGATDTLRPGYGSVALVEKGTLNIASGAEMINNTAQHGGAIVNNGGTMETGKILFQGNTATGYAGAIYNTGIANIGANSAFSNNSGKNAGALFNSKTLNVGDNAIFSENTATTYGGAIMNLGGTLETDNVLFKGNTAKAGGALYNNGISHIDDNSIFLNNTAEAQGGAIYNATGTTTIDDNVLFSGNTAKDYGGAIMNNSGVVSVGENATFSGNKTTVAGGGAISNSKGGLNIGTGATFDGNEAAWNGGAIYIVDATANTSLNNATFTKNHSYGNGGAIATNTSTNISIKNSVFSENTALKDASKMGGAIYIGNGHFTITDSTFIKNKADAGGALIAATGGILTPDDTYDYTKSVSVYMNNVTFQDNEAESIGAVGNFSGKVNHENGGMIIKNSRFINNKATKTTTDGGAGALFLGSESFTELDNVVFDGNSSACEGGAIGVRVSTGRGNRGTLKVSNSTFTNNTAATTGGAIDNYFQNFTIENTTFTGNSAANGGAIYNHAEPDNYGNVGTLNLVGKVTFDGNTANGELNDIFNSSKINVMENTVLTLDGGISGTDGTTNFAAGTVLNVKQGATTIENAVSSAGTTLNVTLTRGAETLDLDDIFTHADNTDSLENFHVSQKNALYTLTQNADDVSLYHIEINQSSDVAASLDISQSAADALLATVIPDDATGNAAFDDISHILHERAQYGDASARHAAENLGANASTLVHSRETMHSNMLFTAATDELNGAADASTPVIGTWIRGLFNYANQDDTSKAAGFDANTYGVVAGIDKQFGTHVTFGLGYAYSQTDATGHGRDTDIASNTILAYGQYKSTNWYTNAVLAYSMSDYAESKSVLGYDADADYDVNTLALQSMTGITYKMGEYDLNPETGLRYLHIARDGYTDNLGASVTSQDSDFLTLVAGTKLATDFRLENEMVLRPTLRAAVTYDVISANNNSDVLLPNGAGYTARGERLNRLGFEIGAHAAIAVSGNLEFTAGYEGKFRENYQEHAALLNAKYKF